MTRRLLLVHGLHNARWWLWPLAARFRSQGFEPESFGYASVVGGPNRPSAALVDRPVVDRVVGHSLGGLIALEALRQAPMQRCRGWSARFAAARKPGRARGRRVRDAAAAGAQRTLLQAGLASWEGPRRWAWSRQGWAGCRPLARPTAPWRWRKPAGWPITAARSAAGRREAQGGGTFSRSRSTIRLPVPIGGSSERRPRLAACHPAGRGCRSPSMNSSCPDLPRLIALSMAMMRPSWKLATSPTVVWPTTIRATPSSAASARTAGVSSWPSK